MSGGLINDIPDKNYYVTKQKYTYLPKERKIVDLLTFPMADAKVVGSYSFGITRYWSDIDMLQIFNIRSENDFKKIANEISNKIKKMNKMNNVYLADFKAGYDDNFNKEDRKNYILRWNAEELIKQQKILQNGDIMTLDEAIQMDTIVKWDVVFYTDGRFIEASTFMILQIINPDNTVTVLTLPGDYMKLFPVNMYNDYIKYMNPNDPEYNPFKGLKRLYAYSKGFGDIATLKQISPIILSNLALISQMKGDLEALILLLLKGYDVPFSQQNAMFNKIVNNLATIQDIPINVELIYNFLQTFKLPICSVDFCNTYKESVADDLMALVKYFKSILTRETEKYLNYYKIRFNVRPPTQINNMKNLDETGEVVDEILDEDGLKGSGMRKRKKKGKKKGKKISKKLLNILAYSKMVYDYIKQISKSKKKLKGGSIDVPINNMTKKDIESIIRFIKSNPKFYKWVLHGGDFWGDVGSWWNTVTNPKEVLKKTFDYDLGRLKSKIDTALESVTKGEQLGDIAQKAFNVYSEIMPTKKFADVINPASYIKVGDKSLREQIDDYTRQGVNIYQKLKGK